MHEKILDPDLLHRMDAYWRAANYLAVGQIYLRDNPLLRRPLALGDIKHMLLGHWGTTPGQNFIYVHLNRVIRKYDLDMIYVSGPGHGGPAVVGNTYLEGTYSEIYPDISQDEAGLQKLFKQFSFPGGIPSHASPECPGSIHEGGELGYSLSHAFGAVFDNPQLIVACVIGDGEAETGPLATAWHSNKFLDAATDGAVLPILHLNGYKIANPTVLARISREELEQLLRGCGWTPIFVEGHEPALMHEAMATALDTAVEQIRAIQHDARAQGNLARPRWPMIVLISPKGWTGPKVVDGLPVEGTFRAHQVPIAVSATTPPEHLRQLEDWLQSYRPAELFDAGGRLRPELAALAPAGTRRMGANPHANGGILLRELRMPDFRDYACAVPAPGTRGIGDTHVLGPFLRDLARLNDTQRNFRVFGPDETLSNGLESLFEATTRQWDAVTEPNDEFLAPSGRVMEMLSEHQCEGWLEGYLLTGRHGLFNCYEAFIHIVDSMFNQHAKWLKVTRGIAWRRPIASLNYLLSSHVWRQDHNGFSHQDPGFIDHVVNKKAEVVRVYLPPDANCLLSVADHCLRSRNYVNVIVAGKQPELSWLGIDDAIVHCTRGAGIFEWASNDAGSVPDVVMASCGDVPTLETLAAVDLIRQHLPELAVRVVNVVDLMRLQPEREHPHGMSDAEFDALFTTSSPIVFAYHGYPWLIHRLTYRRQGHHNLHVRGYKEEGTTTTPFDMVMMNDLDRFHLVMDVIDRVPGLASRAGHIRQQMSDRRLACRQYTREFGDDPPEIREWTWPY
ncbi:MAG TPA: phosphoketolase family protein [Acidimicrobiales bacterium]|nr:phosphoketolase family protein [Acidimicrobiales bacterium]